MPYKNQLWIPNIIKQHGSLNAKITILFFFQRKCAFWPVFLWPQVYRKKFHGWGNIDNVLLRVGQVYSYAWVIDVSTILSSNYCYCCSPNDLSVLDVGIPLAVPSTWHNFTVISILVTPLVTSVSYSHLNEYGFITLTNLNSVSF